MLANPAAAADLESARGVARPSGIGADLGVAGGDEHDDRAADQRAVSGLQIPDLGERIADGQLLRIAGEDLVAWRVDGETVIAPDACPHMGASLADARVEDGKLICPWHGLALGREGHGAWKTYPVHEDGVLAWVRIGPEEPETPRPVLAPRPTLFMEGVVRMEARCDPEDVIANRLDPWHGAHFHPYSFAALSVLDPDEDVLKVRVAKKLVGRLVVETDATFHSPEPRTIVMTIVEGEGKGSVVETHATPIEPGRTAVVEAIHTGPVGAVVGKAVMLSGGTSYIESVDLLRLKGLDDAFVRLDTVEGKASPVGIHGFLTAIPRGLEAAADIIFFIFIDILSTHCMTLMLCHGLVGVPIVFCENLLNSVNVVALGGPVL